MEIFIEPKKEIWDAIISRPVIETEKLKSVVSGILQGVKDGGDDALIKYTAQFDGVQIDQLIVGEEEFIEAERYLNETLKNAIDIAIKNIYTFHESQREDVRKIETTQGVECWRESIGIEKVGLYIPGGSAPLFSTLLMLAIPAKIAGCKEIIICTPPQKNGQIAPSVLYSAKKLGIKTLFKVGGVQAIGAMAFGTKSIPKVYKIFGPGNQYVTAAKQMVNNSGIAIDMPAGPSEVAIYADDTSNPSFVASDLLSQAEHGADSQVLLVAQSIEIVNNVIKEIQQQSKFLSRKAIIEKCLTNSHFVVLKNIDDAFDLLNAYAAEHLIISTDAPGLAEKVVNAGSVFLGHYTPESMGDYASGTNHTLPTNGYAKSYSGVSVDSFIKKVTFQRASQQGLKNLGPIVEVLALEENLDAHKMAITTRLNYLNNIQ